MSITNKIGLGTVQFGLNYGISNQNGITPKEEVARILTYSKKNGIDILDTASTYGEAEELLGNFNLKAFRIVSKFMPQESGKSIEYQLQSSLQKLNVDSLYAYLAHRPLSVLNTNCESWESLLKLKKEGLIKKIGFSLNETSELSHLLKAELIPDIIQVPYNYFDQRFYPFMVELKKKGCEIHTRSTFLQGLFFCKIENLNSHFDIVKPIIDTISKKENLSGLLIRYVIDNEFVDKVIIGVNTLSQLQDNLLSTSKVSDSLEVNILTIPDSILMPSQWPSI